MNIGVDIDGVLADFNSSYIKLIFQKSGVQLPMPGPDYPNEWNYTKSRIRNKDLNAVWDEIKATHFWDTLGPEPLLLETIELLLERRSLGDDIYFITSRPGLRAKFYTERWLIGHGMLVPSVLIAEHAEAKGHLARGLALDVFIDDKPDNIDAITHADCVCYLVDRPYNRKFSGYNRVPSALAALEEVFLAKRAA